MFLLSAFIVSAFSLGDYGHDHAGDTFDRFDANGDSFLEIADLEQMMKYASIFHETDQNKTDMTHEELSKHKAHFAELWFKVMEVVGDLNVNADGHVDLGDLEELQNELAIIQQAIAFWTAEKENVEGLFGNSTTLISDMDALKENSIFNFNERIDTAFTQLGGSDTQTVSFDKFSQYTEEIALLWTVMEELMNQQDSQNPSVGKDKFEAKLKALGVHMNTEAQVHHDYSTKVGTVGSSGLTSSKLQVPEPEL